MSVGTIAPPRNATSPQRGWRSARAALAQAYARAAQAASEARRRYRRPSLVVSGFACIDAAAYQIGLGWGLLVTGLSLLAFEAIGGEE